ncbi:ADP-ribose diphosphatase [Alteromonas pelagimontana]|uniref:ADP-ribose pyrophosphatase n=1 Tax=Alteromonas pelagimontana TaxID=1858656 RepID=A0A6M4MBH7_9ALTE|nr:ADP-ribose diphosphatase [Alteromonas pelagimontana]QJR80379.1 ADP-ribose diphosphatase [Alteromonas pelagimontana]
MNKKIQMFTSNDVEIESTTPLYNGFFKMVKYDFRHKLFGGGWSEKISREVFERGHAVAVLPYDPITGEFVLIEQFRIGALATSDTPWLFEVIAGIIEKGEVKEAVCHREAQEESGIELAHLTKALSYLASPGGTTERIHIYVAATDATKASGIHGLHEEAEDIRVHRVTEKDAREWLENGGIDNAATIIALQWFFMHKQTLLENWQVKN